MKVGAELANDADGGRSGVFVVRVFGRVFFLVLGRLGCCALLLEDECLLAFVELDGGVVAIAAEQLHHGGGLGELRQVASRADRDDDVRRLLPQDLEALLVQSGTVVVERLGPLDESHHEVDALLAAQVRDIRPLGAITRVTLKVEGQDELIEAEVVKDHDSLSGLTRGETLYFRPKVWQRQAAL